MKTRTYLYDLKRKAFVTNLTFAVFLFYVMFSSSQFFVFEELFKWYAFIIGGLLFFLLSLLIEGAIKIDIDFLST